MGFFKTLFTGARDDELSENEKERFEEFQSNGNTELLDDSSSHLELENSSKLNIDLVIAYIEKKATYNELSKIKNAIVAREDEEYDSKEESITESKFLEEEKMRLKLKLKPENTQKSNSINTNKKDIDNEEIVVEDDSFEEDLKKGELEFDDEYVDLDEEEDTQISTVNKLEDEDSFDDPTLFSVVHDELMELFKQGQVVLLKEEFTFPTLGVRETLAFGIFNSTIEDVKEQTHWFVQHLKEFSRLKECKMLLSEENEKDLILEIGDKHAILLCFKSNNLITNEFEFNRKWS